MDVSKKIDRIKARIRVITERMENEKKRHLLRLNKEEKKKETLLKILRSVCPHEKTEDSGEFVECESGMRYERWRTCIRCGLRT